MLLVLNGVVFLVWWLQTKLMFFVLWWNACYHGWGGVGWGAGMMMFAVDCKRRWCSSCSDEMRVIMGGVGWGGVGWGAGMMTFAVDCKRRCSSCSDEMRVIMGGVGWGRDDDVRCRSQTKMMFFVFRWNACYHGWGGVGMMMFVVDCKRRWCSSCSDGMHVIMGGMGWAGMMMFVVDCKRRWCSSCSDGMHVIMGGVGWAGMMMFFVDCKQDVLRVLMKCVLSWVGWGGAGMMMFVVDCKRRWSLKKTLFRLLIKHDKTN